MEIEVDTFWIYFEGGISKTRLAVGHKGRKDIRKDSVRFLFAIVWMVMLFIS